MTDTNAIRERACIQQATKEAKSPKQPEFKWIKDSSGGFTAEMPDNVTLCVTPDRYAKFGGKPARGTAWRAQASHWCEETRTVSRFGRDEYTTLHPTSKDARIAAEKIYLAATSAN